MSTTQVVTDLKTTAHETLTAIGTAIASILGDVSAEVAPLSNDGLAAAESAIENLIPAGVARDLVSTIVSTANPAAHALLSAKLDAPAVALLAIGAANVASALSHLEAVTSTSSAQPASASPQHAS